MRLLVFNWGAYTYPDIKDSLTYSGVSVDTVNYHFGDKNHDEYFEDRFSKILKGSSYDAVFSVNFFPLVAKCCHCFGIKYISWSYDNPLNVPDIEDTLEYETNFVFLFDRIQAETYQRKGFQTVYHMSLAVNVRRLDKIQPTRSEKETFSSEISFVGKLYDSGLQLYMSAMNDYQKGYIESLIRAQGQLYGAYLLDDMITEDFIHSVNATYRSRQADTKFQLSKEALTYAMAAQVTREERLTLLSLLAGHHQVKLYSREDNELLKKAQFMGSCGYLEEMPRIFKLTKINLNITLKILQSGIPLRALDILGAGGFLLTNYQPEIAEHFQDGEEAAFYTSIEDAVEKADYYLSHEEERKRIAAGGREKAMKEFSYEGQLQKIFTISGLNL